MWYKLIMKVMAFFLTRSLATSQRVKITQGCKFWGKGDFENHFSVSMPPSLLPFLRVEDEQVGWDSDPKAVSVADLGRDELA